MIYVGIILLLLINALGVVGVALQLPGTWIMLAAAVGFELIWEGWIGWWVIVGMVVLAILGEVIETVAGAAGSRQAGGSKRAMAGSIIGGIAGAILGTIVIPIPIVGTLAGAAIGAGLGSMAGDKWAGREWHAAWHAGKGAAIGKLWGTVGKLAVAVAMWLLCAVAIVL